MNHTLHIIPILALATFISSAAHAECGQTRDDVGKYNAQAFQLPKPRSSLDPGCPIGQLLKSGSSGAVGQFVSSAVSNYAGSNCISSLGGVTSSGNIPGFGGNIQGFSGPINGGGAYSTPSVGSAVSQAVKASGVGAPQGATSGAVPKTSQGGVDWSKYYQELGN